MNRDNLTKLAHHLLALPKDYQHFDMGIYVCFPGSESLSRDELNYLAEPHLPCGAVACALGHGPLAGIPVPDSCVSKSWGVYWEDYCRRQFGTDLYEWCFSPNWAAYDNTPQGAGARILYLLDHGVPENFEYDPSIYRSYLP